MSDPSMVRIEPPSEERMGLLRPAAEMVARALSRGWDSDGPEAVIDGLAVMRPYTRWIGACDTVVDDAHLRLLHDVLERCIDGRCDHPDASSFPMDGPTLALSMMLARMDDRRPRSAKAMMLAEEPHPWGPPRLHQRDPKLSGLRPSESMLDESDAIRWSALAPPAVKLFLSDQQVGHSVRRMPLTLSLIPVLHTARIDRLTMDPVARLRARAMLDDGGKGR